MLTQIQDESWFIAFCCPRRVWVEIRKFRCFHLNLVEYILSVKIFQLLNYVGCGLPAWGVCYAPHVIKKLLFTKIGNKKERLQRHPLSCEPAGVCICRHIDPKREFQTTLSKNCAYKLWLGFGLYVWLNKKVVPQSVALHEI